MAVRVFVRRMCHDSGKEKEVFGLVRKLRSLVPMQSGYLSSRYVKKIELPSDVLAISTWETLEDWYRWYESEERKAIQGKIDAIPGVQTTYEIYKDVTTG